MDKVLGYIAGVLFVVASLAGVGLYVSVRANGTLRAERDTATEALARAEKARKATEALLVTVRAEKAAQARKSALDQKAISGAVKAAPEWAGATTPPAVAEALARAVEGLE